MSRKDRASSGWCKIHRNKIICATVVLVSVVAGCIGISIIRRGPQAESTLRFVSIVHRHGDRAPFKIYPLDPYKGEYFWPEGLGSLLQRGKVRMYEFGRFLRHRYDGFVSSTYKPAETFVISSEVDRCIMSAELVLAGLYPPDGIQVWNQDLLWQPIPVHSVPSSCDDIIQVGKQCSLLSKEEEQWEMILQKEVDKDPEFVSYLSKSTGSAVKTMIDINYIRDCHRVLINDIILNMERKSNSTSNFNRRLHLYSAHDVTITNLWRGMNFSQELTEIPPYGSALIIELHEVEHEFRVKVLYRKGKSEELSILTIRGCEDGERNDDKMCDLETFASALQPVIITDFEEVCQNQTPQ